MAVNAWLGLDMSAKMSLKSQDKVTEADPWRLRYIELIDIPVRGWPIEASDYAIYDAVLVRDLATAQGSCDIRLAAGDVCIDGEYLGEYEMPLGGWQSGQVAAHWALHTIECHGNPINPDSVGTFIHHAEVAAARWEKYAQTLGIIRVNKCKVCQGTGMSGTVPDIFECPTCAGDRGYIPKGCRVPLAKTAGHTLRLKEWVTYAFGGEPPRKEVTAKNRAKGHTQGSIQTDGDTLLASELPELVELQVDKAAVKLLSTYVPPLREAAKTGWLHAAYGVLVRSWRTSSWGPNMQNPPQAGGFRECIEAPPGYVLMSVDYTAQEMGTLAQTCLDVFGVSPLADAINAGKDVHSTLTVDLLELEGVYLSYEDIERIRHDPDDPQYTVVTTARNLAKVLNFGIPGGMGNKAFTQHARTQGFDMTTERAVVLRAAFFKRWTSVEKLLKVKIGGMSNRAGRDSEGKGLPFAYRHPRSQVVRGGMIYTSAANHNFQHLAAIITKEALVRVVHEAMTDPSSPLWGVRVINHIHDELLALGPKETMHAWGWRISEIMVEVGEHWTPHVRVAADPAAMYKWTKKAQTVHKDGKLVAWEPTAE
jgi:hypothetical protein